MAFTVPTTFAELQHRAEQGETNLYVALGVATYFGRYKDESFTPNPDQALHWWRKAALKGETYGLLFTHSVCTYATPRQPQKILEALLLALEQASSAGNLDARCSLAWAYLDGIGKPKDPKHGFTLLKDGFDQQHLPSTTFMGHCFQLHKGVNEDKKNAVKLYEQAAKKNHPPAISNLGSCYRNGDGVDKDLKQGAKLLQQATDLGHAGAMNNLGNCYRNGDGVDKDLKRGIELFQQAADLGNAPAMFNLGTCYLQDEEVDKDLKRGIELFQQAADLGDLLALETLGKLYKHGIYVEEDRSKAKDYFEKAEKLKNEIPQGDFEGKPSSSDSELPKEIKALIEAHENHQKEIADLKVLVNEYTNFIETLKKQAKEGKDATLAVDFSNLSKDFKRESKIWLGWMIASYGILSILAVMLFIVFLSYFAHGFEAHTLFGVSISTYKPDALGSPIITAVTLLLSKIAFLALPTVAALFCSRQYGLARHGEIVHKNRAANLNSLSLLAKMPQMSEETRDAIYRMAYTHCLSMEATGFVKDSGPVDNIDSSEATIRLLEQLKGLINK
jgi:TPR repeat protein